MWAPPVNNSGHSTLSTAEPKWVPYMWTKSHSLDVPPEATSSNMMVKNPKPTGHNVSHDSDGTNQPVVRRIASAPLQYQEVIPRGPPTHPQSSKSFTKIRPKTDLPKNQNPPRIKASVSTISWREELTHFKSSHPQSPPKTKSVSKARIHKSEENHFLKNSDAKKVSKNRTSKALSSVDFNGRKEQTSARSIDAILSSLKNLSTNGIHSSNLADLPHSKTELKSHNEDGAHFSHFMDSISATRKLGNVTRSHIDVTDQSGNDNVLQAKKRCSSENNLTTAQKNYNKHKTSGPRSSSVLGKTRHENLTHLLRRTSPKKTEKKLVTEVQETVKEKTKGYDPEKAREYIKQQRCERLSSIREEKERKKASEEAKKQKLSELDQKRHLLLQANIKKKPLQTMEEKPVPQPKTEDLKTPASILVPKSSSVHSNVSLRRPTTVSSTESGLYVFPGPPHPVVLSGDAKHPVDNHPAPRASSDSSAIIIKDIHDMKATIEILSNTIKNALHSSKSELSSRDKKKAPTVVHLQEGSELKIEENIQEVVKIEPKPLSLGNLGLIKDSFDAAEVHHLSNNLRKMKENFRSVLAQNLNVRPKPKSETKLKSAESERSDPALAEMERLQQWLQKIPAGGLSGSSSEIDKAGVSGFHRRPKRRRTKSNVLLNSHQRTRSSTRRHRTSDDSDRDNVSGDWDQENLSGGPLHHIQSPPKSESDTNNIPEWMKPLTQEPYPVNFMSVVKRKMAAKKTEKEAPTSILAFSDVTTNPSQSVPVASNTLSSYNHLNPLYSPITSQDPVIDTHNQQSRNSCNTKHELIPPTEGLFPTHPSHLYSLFPGKPNLVEKSQQTTPKDSVAISPTDDYLNDSDKPLTTDTSSWSGQIINTSVPPLPRLSSTTTEISSRAVSPELVSSGTSTRVSQVSVKPGFVEDEKEPVYESDFEEGPAEIRKSGEDTDAPSISSTIPENIADTDSVRLVTPNVDLFSKKTEKSDWSSRRDCGDGEHASQESSNQTGKESFEVGRLFNPEAIHLQFQAELNRLDAFNESLFHVMEVEKVRAVTLAREQALLSAKPQTTSEQPPSISDKAVSVQRSLPASSADISSINYTRGSGTHSGEISTINYARGSEYSGTPPLNLPQGDVEPAKSVSSGSTIKTDVVENEESTESPSSPVGTSQPSSIPEKSPSPQSSDATISEDIKSLKSPQEAVRLQAAKEKGPLKRLKLRQTSDKVPSETVSRGSKAVSIEDESTEPCVVAHGPDSARSGDAGAVGKTQMERSERRSAIPANNEDAYKFTLQMLEQLMYEEELRVQHKRTLLKLRERVLCDMAKAECASLDLDKKKLRDIGGQEEQISALRKKQRGVLMKFQQQRDEINLMQRTDELVWKERRLMYLRQLHLFRMQMSTRSHKNRRDEEGAVLPKGMVSRGIASRRDHDMDNTPDFNALLASASLSSPSVGSDLSIPSVPLPVNTSGDTESSCIDERPLQSIKDLEVRSRNCRDLDPNRQPVEQLNLWRRRLEEEERQLRDVERHSRHRPVHLKHSLRDRSTSPFQFSEIASNFGRGSGNSKQRSRPISNGSVEEDSSVTEDIPDQHDSILSSVKEVLSAAAVSEAYSESFESIESEARTAESQTCPAEVPILLNGSKETSVRKEASSDSNSVKTKQPLLHERSKGHPSVTIKVPLSPRLQRVQRRRYSSGSDDSIVFSQTETGSEQSDIEGRITALTEQLEQRKAEAERLRREAKRTRSERLLAKEQSLQKQLQAYDVYISQARQNLDAELKQTSVPIVRPQIKQPRVASAGKAKNSNTAQQVEQDVSVQDSVAESSASQDSSLDAATLSPSKQNGAELEFVLPEQSGAKDVISDAMSSVASGDISEVSSENGSTISNENASLIANTGGKNEAPVKKAVLDIGSDTLSNAGSDVGSEVVTDVLSEVETSAGTDTIEDAAKEDVGDTYKNLEESIKVSSALLPASLSNESLEKTDTSDSGDAEDFIEEANDANVIKVILKEKERAEDEKLEISLEPATEDTVQPLIADQRIALVNKITDSILQKLLNDCIQTARTPKKSCEVIIQDSGLEQMEKKAKDVRTRVSKILADTIHSPSSRTEPRMQDLMVTTYDILSPEDSPCTSPHQSSPTRQTSDSAEDSDSRMQTHIKPFEGPVGKVTFQNYSGSSDPASIFNDSFQDWLDEEYSGAAEKEAAELLRLKELLIQQRIQLLDQAIDQIPYIREIPNKPPPPYTPPGQAPRVLATSVPCSPPLEEIRAVTKNQSEIIQAVTTATNMFYAAHCRNQDLKTVIPPESFLVEGYTVPEHVKLSEQDLQIHKNSARVYRRLLFDLARQIVEEAYSHEQEEECPPWLQPENVFSKRKALAEAPQSRQELQQVVSKQVLALFGFGPKAEKENLTIRWSRKKRDHVDELLVRELQEEERQWISYEYDEALVKNNVTESILEALLIDTTEVVKEIYQRRQRVRSDDHND